MSWGWPQWLVLAFSIISLITVINATYRSSEKLSDFWIPLAGYGASQVLFNYCLWAGGFW